MKNKRSQNLKRMLIAEIKLQILHYKRTMLDPKSGLLSCVTGTYLFINYAKQIYFNLA